MSEDFEYFSSDFNNWNNNEWINKPGVNPRNNKKKLDPCFNLINFTYFIMFKEILKHKIELMML